MGSQAEFADVRDGFAHDIDRLGGKEEWLTPPEILKDFGPFDLDPCAPVKRPWPMAARHFTAEDNGLIRPWNGFVWCNPPYGSKTSAWLARCAEHGDCLALIFARTETGAFHERVWNRADGILFIKGRLNFYHASGEKAGAPGAPSCLVAYGATALERLAFNAPNYGKLILLNNQNQKPKGKA